MKDHKEANPEHKIIININDGLLMAEGACEQLVHRHGDGNLKFSSLGKIIGGIRQAVTAAATIPMYRNLRPSPTRSGWESPQIPEEDGIIDPVKEGVNDISLAKKACVEHDGDGLDIPNEGVSGDGGHAVL